MTKHTVIPTWIDLPEAGMWSAQLSLSEANEPTSGAGFFPVDLASSYSLNELKAHRDKICEHRKLEKDADTVTASEGVHVEMRNGVCVLTHNYYEEDVEVHISPDDLIALLDWRIAIVRSEDFNNPSAALDPIDIELEIHE